jgi:hypothetical protein
MTPLPSPVPQCKALYDFKMSSEEEEGCLAFKKVGMCMMKKYVINVIHV